MLLAFVMTQVLAFPQQQDIVLNVTQSEHSQPWAFIAPHENEHVGVDYLTRKIEQFGGTLVVLTQNGQRHLTIKVDDKSFEVDPNRIFTQKGRIDSLTKLNPNYTSHSSSFKLAEQKASALATFILKAMRANEASSWIAIHNNTQGYLNDGQYGRGTISIRRYQSKLKQGAEYLLDVHDAGDDEDDLFFITELQDFWAMQQAQFNVALQHPQVANRANQDDGSLSVLAEMQGRRYVNIEAERRDDDGFGEDHLERQQQMIDFLFVLLQQSP